jgi:hypothetical protein
VIVMMSDERDHTVTPRWSAPQPSQLTLDSKKLHHTIEHVNSVPITVDRECVR